MSVQIERGLKPPKGFERYEYDVNGVRTVVYAGGRGRPLVYWHGAGTWHSFDFAQPWLEEHRVFATFHPGFGESADAPGHMDTINDYLLHYLDLFALLGLRQFDLVGISLGGWLAAEFAVAHREMVRRLVLACPAGLPTPEHPGPGNMMSWSLEELYSHLANDRSVLEPYLPKRPEDEPAHAAGIARDMRSAGRLMAGRGPFNPKLPHWLHRLTMPTLVVWARGDRLAPAARAEKWMQHLPNAQLHLADEGGHLVLDESAAAREAVARFLA